MFFLKCLFLSIFIILISGCNDNAKNEEPKLPPNIYGENYKFGILDEKGKKITPAVYTKYRLENKFVFLYTENNKIEIIDFSGNSLGVFSDIVKESPHSNQSNYYVATITDGKSKSLVFNENINIPQYKEIDKKEYWIYDENFNLVINHPFTSYLFDNPNGKTLPGSYSLVGTYDGNKYIYILTKNGKYELYSKINSGETGEEFFGYKITRYFWDYTMCHYGVNDSKGNVVFDPIYARVIIPFDNRFILGEGDLGMFSSPDEGRYILVDTNRTVLAMYNKINFIMLNDGSFIGIARIEGPNPKVVCYDENEKILQSGYWFIDKNGKQISKRFENLLINEDDIYNISDSCDIITGIDDKGNVVEFLAEDYVIIS